MSDKEWSFHISQSDIIGSGLMVTMGIVGIILLLCVMIEGGYVFIINNIVELIATICGGILFFYSFPILFCISICVFVYLKRIKVSMTDITIKKQNGVSNNWKNMCNVFYIPSQSIWGKILIYHRWRIYLHKLVFHFMDGNKVVLPGATAGFDRFREFFMKFKYQNESESTSKLRKFFESMEKEGFLRAVE